MGACFICSQQELGRSSYFCIETLFNSRLCNLKVPESPFFLMIRSVKFRIWLMFAAVTHLARESAAIGTFLLIKTFSVCCVLIVFGGKGEMNAAFLHLMALTAQGTSKPTLQTICLNEFG